MSRPGKKSAAPAPLYLTSDLPYCLACGRVVSSKTQDIKAKGSAQNPDGPKYCSVQCKRKKPVAIDRLIERVFVAVLDGNENLVNFDSLNTQEDLRALITAARSRRKKGDQRSVVSCGEVQAVIPFDDLDNGTRKDAVETKQQAGTDQLVENGDIAASTQVLTDSDTKQQLGMKKAEQKEMVKRAARRLVVFGHQTAQMAQGSEGLAHSQRSPFLCEVISGGRVVEPSFAKGDWSIRWRYP